MNVPTIKRVKRYVLVIARWILIVSTGLYIINDLLPKVYTAGTTLRLPAGDLVTPSEGSTTEPVDFQPEFEITMTSPEFLLAIIKELGLDKEWARRLNKEDEDTLPDVDALTHMERIVKIQVKRGTNLVVITAASDVPQEAADIANAMARRYQTLRDLEAGKSGVDRLRPSAVLILQRAETPAEPTRPRKNVDLMLTLIAASFLSLFAASFVEMILLFIRAGERVEG
jgi:capsular polysaccharide biosynthesis protein